MNIQNSKIYLCASITWIFLNWTAITRGYIDYFYNIFFSCNLALDLP